MEVDDSIHVETCRSCSYFFRFAMPNGKVVAVICGKPPMGMSYKAISYLWEKTTAVSLRCKRCIKVKQVPMRGVTKLLRILNFVQEGFIWLDALSIDQDDSSDLEAQIKIMGNIYRQAMSVAVFLPSSDEGAHFLLSKLAAISGTIWERRHEFKESRMNIEALSPAVHPSKHDLVEGYLRLILEWDTQVQEWKYWTRAWTLQEWIAAAELEVTHENALPGSCIYGVKSTIAVASMFVGHHIRFVETPSDFPGFGHLDQRTLIDLVRKHFPYDQFLAQENFDSPGYIPRILTVWSPIRHFCIDAPLLLIVNKPEDSPEGALTLALTMMSVSKREARFEADLVACWASMCNITYSYSPHDSYTIALHKVITTLRRRGMKIYNFIVNTDWAETDTAVVQYAAQTDAHNAFVHAYFLGGPIFTGYVDTLFHIRQCLAQPTALISLPRHFDVSLQPIMSRYVAVVDGIAQFSDHAYVNYTFINCLALVDMYEHDENGHPIIPEIFERFKEMLLEIVATDAARLDNFSLFTCVITSLPSRVHVSAWAIYLTASHCPGSELYVARESLNGTLVLASRSPSGTSRTLAYLSMTHQLRGTSLIRCDEEGRVDAAYGRQFTAEDDATFPCPICELGKCVHSIRFEYGGKMDVEKNSQRKEGSQPCQSIGEDIEQNTSQGRHMETPSDVQDDTLDLTPEMGVMESTIGEVQRAEHEQGNEISEIGIEVKTAGDKGEAPSLIHSDTKNISTCEALAQKSGATLSEGLDSALGTSETAEKEERFRQAFTEDASVEFWRDIDSRYQTEMFEGWSPHLVPQGNSQKLVAVLREWNVSHEEMVEMVRAMEQTEPGQKTEGDEMVFPTWPLRGAFRDVFILFTGHKIDLASTTEEDRNFLLNTPSVLTTGADHTAILPAVSQCSLSTLDE